MPGRRTDHGLVLRIEDHKIVEGRQIKDRGDGIARVAVSQADVHVVDSNAQR